jgi:hypothetical protein
MPVSCIMYISQNYRSTPNTNNYSFHIKTWLGLYIFFRNTLRRSYCRPRKMDFCIIHRSRVLSNPNNFHQYIIHIRSFCKRNRNPVDKFEEPPVQYSCCHSNTTDNRNCNRDTYLVRMIYKF